ncbi:hypothetical protein M9H77_36252 [Catharanthus roseus]|uniref:Uncharacterized protein n=1 Tax=Catharanthus roseus TaxID=4058 RepID=A0ACB9ZTH0_CATRO|nr:hypothetical protein M9H77_36252 [Catharanthus roseus]
MGGYHENHGYQAYLEEDSYYKVGQSFRNRNEGMGREFQEGYDSYEDSSKVRFEEQLREVGVMSNEHIGKKNSIGEPSGPWSKKSKNKESTRSQEVMLDKNDRCEGKERRISVEHCFLDAIPSLFES